MSGVEMAEAAVLVGLYILAGLLGLRRRRVRQRQRALESEKAEEERIQKALKKAKESVQFLNRALQSDLQIYQDSGGFEQVRITLTKAREQLLMAQDENLTGEQVDELLSKCKECVNDGSAKLVEATSLGIRRKHPLRKRRQA